MSASAKYNYEQDFYAWAMHNAELLRQKRLAEIDIEHIAEEIESMGRSDKRELLHRLAILIAHLLKWQYQPKRRGKSWLYTIKEQRLQLIDLLSESPSLKHDLQERLTQAYEQAIILVVKETPLEEKSLPKSCPFSLENCLNGNFFPEEAI